MKSLQFLIKISHYLIHSWTIIDFESPLISVNDPRDHSERDYQTVIKKMKFALQISFFFWRPLVYDFTLT